MRHDSVVSRYAIPIGIPQVNGWSMGPPGFWGVTPLIVSLAIDAFDEDHKAY